MAAQEMYDYLSTIAADYAYTLTLSARGTVTESTTKNQVIHLGADGSEERVSFSSNSIFYLSWSYPVLTEADSGTLLDLYADSVKANGRQRSFRFTHGDGHTYVVRFDCDLSRVGRLRSRYGLPDIKLKVLGRIADA